MSQIHPPLTNGSSSTTNSSTVSSFRAKAIYSTPLLSQKECKSYINPPPVQNPKPRKKVVSILEEPFNNTTDNYTDDEMENSFTKTTSTTNREEQAVDDKTTKNIRLLIAFLFFNILTYAITSLLPSPKPSSFLVDHPVLARSLQTLVMISTLYWYSLHLPLSITKVQIVTSEIIYLFMKKLKVIQLSYWSIAMIIFVSTAALSIESQLIYLLIPVFVVWLVDQYRNDEGNNHEEGGKPQGTQTQNEDNLTRNTRIVNNNNKYEQMANKRSRNNRVKVGTTKLDILYARLDELYETIDRLSKRQIHFSQSVKELEGIKVQTAKLLSENRDLRFSITGLEEKFIRSIQVYQEKTDTLAKIIKNDYSFKERSPKLKRRIARLILTDDHIDLLKLLVSPTHLIMAICSFIFHQVVQERKNLEKKRGL